MSEAAHEAFETRDCKIPGCTNEAVARMGKFAGLCSEHIQARRTSPPPIATARPLPQTAPSTPPPRPSSDTFAQKVKQLGHAGKEVDRLRATAKRATERALAAKQRADSAERDFKRLARELMGDDA